MFHRIFIANRGEVAARMVRACHDLGIEAVCGASKPDMEAGYPYLEQASQVVCLGPGPATDSYLRMRSIIQAARQTGCGALHPGWGFLAENPLFAELCRQHGVTFIGPSPAVMDQMGRKVASRQAAQAAGLPVVPGSPGLLRDPEEAVAVAREVGYPVALKADAGGGGRGIRRCEDDDQVRQAFADASREAQAAFGSADLYLEKYLEGGRHIEFQVLGDGRGNAIHLGERECSIQRRHQKLVEEAPSPVISAEERERYGNMCAEATARWRYRGAGTMEFLRAQNGELFFLEMNTRLQVEHPVTEAITGFDLAAAMIRIAAGHPLPWKQKEIQWQGHAIEVRVNAEDPAQDFRPHPGKVERFQVAGPGIRVDTHLQDGSRIPPHYDSLMAKIIAHGKNREEAIERLQSALAGASIAGLPTTIPLHQKILDNIDFRRAEFDTLWLSRNLSAMVA
ncbi:MAG: acetyl-CoA carboxylase biotin carboxylase subunit [Planctomycetota bacterium]|nr:MAG: acetyl-CoA carboxylase biotin carboxylase subunit [Planctomycetota bacterium]